MDDPRERDLLAYYPYVTVRIHCDICHRRGAYRLARLAAKYGAQVPLDQLLYRLSFDCPWRSDRRGDACGVQYTDLPRVRPPDLPPGAFGPLRVVPGGRR